VGDDREHPGEGAVTEDLVDALQQLVEALQRQETLGAALAAIAEAATTSVPRCDAATIALSIEGRPITAAMTARFALALDLVQYDSHDGPCLTAFPTMSPLRLDVAEEGEAFPTSPGRRRSEGSAACSRCRRRGAATSSPP
jgi:hypothetical protein